jgi:hypothetical protein
MERGRTPGEPGHCEIESSPKEMDGTDLAEKPRAKSVKDAVNRHKSVEEALDGLCIVGSNLTVMLEWDRIGDFVGPSMELRFAAKLRYQLAEPRMKIGNGHRSKRDFHSAPIACLADYRMSYQIEDDLDTRGVGYQ